MCEREIYSRSRLKQQTLFEYRRRLESSTTMKVKQLNSRANICSILQVRRFHRRKMSRCLIDNDESGEKARRLILRGRIECKLNAELLKGFSVRAFHSQRVSGRREEKEINLGQYFLCYFILQRRAFVVTLIESTNGWKNPRPASFIIFF